MRTARYDGIADFYDQLFADYADDDQPGAQLARLLGPGPGPGKGAGKGAGKGVCLDIGCGTGLGAVTLAARVGT